VIGLPTVVLVTGTDTGVGKTVVTAALMARLARTRRVGVFKPAQTGVGPGDPGDVDDVRRLAGLDDVHEGVRLRDPLAPTTAARLQGVTPPTVDDHARTIAKLAAERDHVLVEGAGGLLVGLDAKGNNLADLAMCLGNRLPGRRDERPDGGVGPDEGVEERLRARLVGTEVPFTFVVVVRPGLGTLNHAGLTVEALRARRLPIAGLVIGSWPDRPGLAERCNLTDLPLVTGVPVIGRVPVGAGLLDRTAFCTAAPGWFESGDTFVRR
jgi:dethiobiotin synthetase